MKHIYQKILLRIILNHTFNLKKGFVLLLISILSLGGFNQLYAQQKTAYEKKIEQLANEVAQKFGYPYYNETVESLIHYGALQLRLGNYIHDALIVDWWLTEMEKAEKLKTPKEIELDKENEEKKIVIEILIALAEDEVKYENSDKGKIENEIKERFEKWQQKGEFEKSEEWQERLKNNSNQQFNEICIETLRKYCNMKFAGTLLSYNADLEYFPVKFTFKTDWVKRQNNPLYYAGQKSDYSDVKTVHIVHMPIAMENAENFKSKYSEHYWKSNIYDYVFVNNYLCPNKVIYQEYNNRNYIDKFVLDVPLPESKEIELFFDDLKIENEYAKGAVFFMSLLEITMKNEEKKKKIEAQRKLKIEFYNQHAKFFPDTALFEQEYEKNGVEAMTIKAKQLKIAYEKERDSLYYHYKNFYWEKYRTIEDYQNAYDKYGKEFLITTMHNILKTRVKRNARINKEWEKNGKYFDDMVEFYNTYLYHAAKIGYIPDPYYDINPDYKKILKEKEKEKKQKYKLNLK